MIVQSCRVNDGNRLSPYTRLDYRRQTRLSLLVAQVVLALWTVPVNVPNNLGSAGRRVRVVK